LTEDSQTDHFSRGSIVESTHWMVLRRPSEPARITGHWKITSDRSSDAWKITAGAIGLATLVHFDTQLRRNDLFKIIQGLVYLRKHAFARGFAEELRDSEKIVASFDLHPKVIHEI